MRTKQQIQVYNKRYYEKNKDKENQRCKKWKKDNQWWYLKNKHILVKKGKEWQDNNPDKRKEICRRYRQKNRDKVNAYQNIYRDKKSEEIKERARIRRRAHYHLRKKMLERDNHRCVECGHDGTKHRLEMHEKVYEEPLKLENVETRCCRCHGKLRRIT